MADSNTVVTIDQQHFGHRPGVRRSPTVRTIGRKSRTTANRKLHDHTSKQALTAKEIERLIDAAMHSPRSGLRDAALILLAYRHGFKVSELINLKWDHIDFEHKSILVSRLRNGQETLQPLDDREIKLLRQLEQQSSELVFQSQRKNPMSSTHIRKIIRHAGEEAGMKKTVYPNMLSGSAGFDLITASTSSETGNTTTRH